MNTNIFLYILIATCNNLAHSMLNLINENRKKQNLKILKSIQNLENAARDQALYMCENSILTHNNPGGDLGERVRKNGFKGSSIGENIAKNHSDRFEDVSKMWMESLKHKKNIMGEFNYTGVATCLDKKGGRFWVQVFGKDVGEDQNNDIDSNNDIDNTVTLEDKNEPNQYNTAEELLEPNINNRASRKPISKSLFDQPLEMKRVCYDMEDCMQSSVSQPKVKSISIKTSFVPISSVFYSTVYKTIRNPISILTVIKTEPKDPLSTLVVITSLKPESIKTSPTMTVTKTITRTTEIPAVNSSSTESASTAENTVTKTTTTPIYITKTVHLEKTVTNTISRTPNKENKTVKKRPRLIELIPKNDVEPDLPSDIENIVESPKKLLNKKNKKYKKKTNRKSNNLEDKLKKLLQGINKEKDNENLSESAMENDENYLNSNCGGSDNPCIKMYLFKE